MYMIDLVTTIQRVRTSGSTITAFMPNSYINFYSTISSCELVNIRKPR